jgi:hypothetical protein
MAHVGTQRHKKKIQIFKIYLKGTRQNIFQKVMTQQIAPRIAVNLYVYIQLLRSYNFS